MTREEKNKLIDDLTESISNSSVFYLADIATLDAEKSSSLRRTCFKNDIKINVVKNTLLKKAFEKSGKDYSELFNTLKGNTAIMFASVGNAPAKVIKEFRKASEKPVLKGAYIDESFYIGDENLEALASLKSKEEVIGDIIFLLQSPAQNGVSALQSGKNKIGGLIKALEERAA